MRLVEMQVKEDAKTEVDIIKKAALILRRRIFEYMKAHPVNFQGLFENNLSACPPALSSFSRWLLSDSSTQKPSGVLERQTILPKQHHII